MDGVPTKTPVSLLHEMCTRNNVTPKYELLQVEGAVHEPIFQYRLTVEHNKTLLEETGSGRSKKEAKHNTAIAMLQAMRVNATEAVGDRIGPVCPAELDELRATSDSDLGGNPVGQLQELCMKMKFPPPNYDVHSEEGLPHERIFAMSCHVGEQYVEIGKGKSKKLAKRMAAHMMAERLRSIPSETSNVHSYDDDDDKIIDGLNALSLSKDQTGNKPSIATRGDIEKIAQLYKIYEEIAKDKMAILKDPNYIVEDPIEFLEDLGTGGTFKAVFIDFDEPSTLDRFQCFVQVTCDPPAVIVGEGATKKEAKMDVAINAIKLFRDFFPIDVV